MISKLKLFFIGLSILSSAFFFLTSCNLFGSGSGSVTIINKTKDLKLKVLSKSSEKVLKPSECVSISTLNSSKISYTSLVITELWLKKCESNASCDFSKGAYLVLCEGMKCAKEGVLHYELQGSLAEEVHLVAAQNAPSECLSQKN